MTIISYRTHDVWFSLRLWLFFPFSILLSLSSVVLLLFHSLSFTPSLTPSLCLSTIPFSRCSIVHETGIICYIIFYIYYWMLSTLNTTICRYGFFVFKFFAWSMSKIKTLSVCVCVCVTLSFSIDHNVIQFDQKYTIHDSYSTYAMLISVCQTEAKEQANPHGDLKWMDNSGERKKVMENGWVGGSVIDVVGGGTTDKNTKNRRRKRMERVREKIVLKKA